MCGIAGIATLEGFDPRVLISMTHLVKHRGPDGYGFFYTDLKSNSAGECFYNQDSCPALEKPSLGFGARRLAILDLSDHGIQPMQIEGGQYWITYNGEVYNYLEIREELERTGQHFRTRTDTEVVLKAYLRWGPACVNRFNGMWSFAIWDRAQRRLFCSRDRFGVKPFYYFVGPSFFVFGSEIKQILQWPNVPRVVDESIALQYLEQGIQDHSENTFFVGVRQLPPGHFLTVDLASSTLSIRIKRYWDLPIEMRSDLPEKDAVEHFSRLLRRAVNWRLRSDVPVGSCLSGGLDSSSIVTLATTGAQNRQFHAFSSCFDEESIDEREFIREVVSLTGATSHLVFPKAEGFWDELNCLTWHQDEPIGGASVYAQWCVMRAARRAEVPVLLDGQGGDEILCGYRKFYFFYLWHLFKHVDPRFMREGIAWICNANGTLRSWEHAKRYVPSFLGNRASLLTRVCNSDLVRDVHALRVDIGPGANLQQRQKADLTHFSIPALLHYEDRNSMAHAIEARVPMLDYELASFVVNCPVSLKLREGWTKWILRQALAGTLPEPVRWRKSKLGFAAPQKDWLHQDTRGTIRSLAMERRLKMSRILSIERIRTEFDSFIARKPGCMTDLEAFRVLNLEQWARVFDVS
jgi:asparagine synthase (glutamine-hydrolysing)